MSGDIHIEPVTDRAWLDGYIRKHWGDPGIISRGRLWTADELLALQAKEDGEIAGVVSWRTEAKSAEIMTLDSDRPGHGVGTRLLAAAIEALREGGRKRVGLITSNDNIDALRFYQRRGWQLAALYPGAMTESRKLKPSIPATGAHGIPIRDEIELEYPL